MAFQYKNGFLFCESVQVNQIQKCLEQSGVHGPVFIYSQQQLQNNIRDYVEALKKLSNKFSINYSVKANSNPDLLKIIKDSDCSLTLVSGNELRLALRLGFDARRLVFNGNGKCRWETTLAVQSGCLMNVDSEFDLRQNIDVCKDLNINSRVLLRINFNIDANVHPYVSTGMAGSKFGIDEEQLDDILNIIKSNSNYVTIVGLHCHLGSTIENMVAIRLCLLKIKSLITKWNRVEFIKLQYINIGGGLNIDYYKYADETQCVLLEDKNTVDAVDQWIDQLDEAVKSEVLYHHQLYKDELLTRAEWLSQLHKAETKSTTSLPECLKTKIVPSPIDLVDVIGEVEIDQSLNIILEPGRSIIGNTAVLACTVLGCKKSAETRYIVIDGSMTEVIRPSLYGSYHHIDLAQPTPISSRSICNVVGPVCESSDFLGKDRYLKTPHVGCGIVVWDVGAYCNSMSSTYNLRGRGAEVLVNGAEWRLIKKQESFSDIMSLYTSI